MWDGNRAVAPSPGPWFEPVWLRGRDWTPDPRVFLDWNAPCFVGRTDSGEGLTMKTMISAGVCLLLATTAFAADRLTDRDVKGLVSRIEDGRNRFDDALDGKLKNTILRGPSGEVDVKRFLNDFQESIDRL